MFGGCAMSEPIGNLLDSLGVTHTPDDDELISGAVVLLKVVDTEGNVTLRCCFSDGMSWIERLGMLRAAEQSDLADLADMSADE